MKFTTAFLFAATAWGVQHHHRRDTTNNGINLSAITSALENLMANQTASANFANISPPPKSLIPEILSVVPVSVIWELINPAERSSLASQFKAGTTPAWYSALPSDVQSYMSVVKSQISAGALTATTSEINAVANTGTAATVTATASVTGATAGGLASSTSSKGAAAQPTGLTVSALGALGVLGLALAL
ncbi:hypothetical protein DTO006G1_2640 [Penicillium roqueforti]|nr:hypothetical protein CBS147337_2658 [Penicillium roqueforti]KAI2690204.1 hypothetical protein CBS147355_655 [Penicillium roqueforti]KAI2702707.1 hypothetical protein CBS147372_4440 [Penicillium roqueforti]KAI2762703.1 hypothetical protein DTO006G1_2640 [Penicillium roqueforti]KAI3114615.1 hypothetical protein CBS147333_1770 [Penicillium roqueforti]